MKKRWYAYSKVAIGDDAQFDACLVKALYHLVPANKHKTTSEKAIALKAVENHITSPSNN